MRVSRTTADSLPDIDLPDGEVWLGLIEVTAGFVDLLGLTLAHGRTFEAADTRPVLVNETMARALWGRSDAVGEAFRQGTVVGVLRDVNFGHPAEPIPPIYFTPVSLVYDVLVRSAHAPDQLAALLQQRRDTGALDIEFDSVERLTDVWNGQFAADRTRLRMSAAAAGLIVLLATFGFYGTARYLIAAGRREYAIRAAVGASPGALGRLVLRRGLQLGVPGLLFGGLLALIAVAWLRNDFLTAAVPTVGVVTVVALALLVVLLAASFGPSLQVRSTPPAPLLRED